VASVTLFETVATWLPTQEQASLSNGSLANSRIINWNRSTQAQFHLFFNFPIDTSYEKILLFKGAVEEYLRVRPREWLSLNGFRCNRFYHERGYVEYILVVQHRDRWSNVAQVLDSKANITSYCMEVAKQLKMDYTAPPLPVDLRYDPGRHDSGPPLLGVEGHSQTSDEKDHRVIDSVVGDGTTGNDRIGNNNISSSDNNILTNEDLRSRTFRSMAQNQHNIRVA